MVKVIIYTDDATIVDGVTAHRPLSPGITQYGMGAVLGHIAQAHPSAEVSVLLAGEMPDAFALPLAVPDDDDPASTTHEVLTSARARGWKCARLAPWMTFYRDGDSRPPIHVAVFDWLKAADFPFLERNYYDVGLQMAQWHRTFGLPWRGTPGVMAMAMLRSGMVAMPKGHDPLWQLKNGEGAAWAAAEQPFTRKTFERDHPGRFVVALDANKQHLATIQSGLFAADALRPGPKHYDPKLAGYWLVELDPWLADPELPDPAGYAPGRRDDGHRWITTPTLRLLEELQQQGIYGGYKILQSRIAHGTQLLRPWGEAMRKTLDDPGTPESVARAVKGTYKRGAGMLARPGGRVYRPDWWSTIVADSRRKLWLRLHNAADHLGVRPLYVDTDCVYYATDDPATFVRDIQDVFPIGTKLGQFKLSITDTEVTGQ